MHAIVVKLLLTSVLLNCLYELKVQVFLLFTGVWCHFLITNFICVNVIYYIFMLCYFSFSLLGCN
jgi:hypothetical protein